MRTNSSVNFHARCLIRLDTVRYAWDSFEEAAVIRTSEFGSFDRAEDLFSCLLTRGVERLARRGLDRSYLAREDELQGVRGKIELNVTLKRGSLIRHRLVCSFDDLSVDVVHNQIIAATLGNLSACSSIGKALHRDIQMAMSRMRGVSEVTLSRRLFAGVQLDRNRRQYRFLVNICRLLYDLHFVDQSTGQVSFADADLDKMKLWQVFERFAARFYDKHQRVYCVRPQTEVNWWDLRPLTKSSEGRIPVMKPDLVLEGADRRLIIDTKYYGDGGLGDETNARLHSGHLYQLFAYVVNREMSNEGGPVHEGILLYPTVGDETRIDFLTHGRRFQARSVDLGSDWESIHSTMLQVIDLE